MLEGRSIRKQQYPHPLIGLTTCWLELSFLAGGAAFASIPRKILSMGVFPGNGSISSHISTRGLHGLFAMQGAVQHRPRTLYFCYPTASLSSPLFATQDKTSGLVSSHIRSYAVKRTRRPPSPCFLRIDLLGSSPLPPRIRCAISSKGRCKTKQSPMVLRPETRGRETQDWRQAFIERWSVPKVRLACALKGPWPMGDPVGAPSLSAASIRTPSCWISTSALCTRRIARQDRGSRLLQLLFYAMRRPMADDWSEHRAKRPSTQDGLTTR